MTTPNPIRTAMRNGVAQAHFALSRAIGIPITYVSGCAGTITGLYAIPRESSAEMRTSLGMRGRDIKRTFEVAMQTGFPPAEGIMEDDTITDDLGITYSVVRDDSDDLDAVFVMAGVSTLIKQIGPVGD